VAAFNTDVAYFDESLRKKGGRAFLIGPGSILDAHSDHELIRIDEMQKAVGYYEEIVGKLLSEKTAES
jgi:acetylornithine deacetylase/succinyl-diaminopimelate desuccinylase-like protein